ncbi:MAG: hypothetical protein JSS72_02840 [Armatimonadetes bacterium]|nr:hypothetical protein [Armatimonadota bacterium]
MVLCKCGKPIEKIPEWMEGITIEFVCNNCPNRQTKNIAFVTLESEKPVLKLDDEEEEEAIEPEDEPD